MTKNLTRAELIQKVDNLKDSESLVYLSEVKNNGYFIRNTWAVNTWAVTKPELLELQKTLTKWTSKKENKGALWG
tara:strand:+ start:1777 stop:2001 length:225 start_codon:yes stop_codon:yes gene_type:complete